MKVQLNKRLIIENEVLNQLGDQPPLPEDEDGNMFLNHPIATAAMVGATYLGRNQIGNGINTATKPYRENVARSLDPVAAAAKDNMNAQAMAEKAKSDKLKQDAVDAVNDHLRRGGTLDKNGNPIPRTSNKINKTFQQPTPYQEPVVPFGQKIKNFGASVLDPAAAQAKMQAQQQVRDQHTTAYNNHMLGVQAYQKKLSDGYKVDKSNGNFVSPNMQKVKTNVADAVAQPTVAPVAPTARQQQMKAAPVQPKRTIQ